MFEMEKKLLMIIGGKEREITYTEPSDDDVPVCHYGYYVLNIDFPCTIEKLDEKELIDYLKENGLSAMEVGNDLDVGISLGFNDLNFKTDESDITISPYDGLIRIRQNELDVELEPKIFNHLTEKERFDYAENILNQIFVFIEAKNISKN